MDFKAIKAPSRTRPTLRKISAIVIFDPSDINRGSAELIEHGFEPIQRDYVDDDVNYNNCIWVDAWGHSDLDGIGLAEWVCSIVEPVGGFVWEIWAHPTNGDPICVMAHLSDTTFEGEPWPT
jgi:hypothetical protein